MPDTKDDFEEVSEDDAKKLQQAAQASDEFEEVTPEEEAALTKAASFNHVAPAPRASNYDVLRAVARSAGVDALGLLPEEKTARGAVASILQGPVMQWADEAAGLVNAASAGPRALTEPNSAARQQIDSRARGYLSSGMQAPEAYKRATEDVLGMGGDLYRQGRDAFRLQEDAFREEHPLAAFALTTASGAASNPLSVEGPSLMRFLPTAAQGAIAGAGSSEDAGGMARGAALGAPLGVAGQAAGELVGAGASLLGRGARRVVTGMVQPSEAAQLLQRKGVDSLTLGQMAPESALAQLEEAGTSVGGIGPALKAQRDVGRGGWQQAVLREVLPPGMEDVPAGGSVNEQLAQVYRGFDDAYAPAKGQALEPSPIQAVLDVFDDPSVRAPNSTRADLAKWLRDQMTALRLTADGKVSSDDVIALRSMVREDLRGEEDKATKALLQKAERGLSDALENGLPDDARRALNAADMQYSKFARVSDAVARSGDQESGFTPAQLSAAVKGGADRAGYARGGGGPLRSLAQAGARTVGAKIPVTGARLLAAGPAPYVTGPLAYLANLPGPKAALTGQTALQRMLAGSDWLQTLATLDPSLFTGAGGALGGSATRTQAILQALSQEQNP